MITIMCEDYECMYIYTPCISRYIWSNFKLSKFFRNPILLIILCILLWLFKSLMLNALQAFNSL